MSVIAAHLQSVEADPPSTNVPGRQGAPVALCRAADEYRDRLAWSVQVIGTSLVLPLTNGLAAVSIPPSMALLTLRNVKQLAGVGPTTVEPGFPGRVVFLVDANDLVVPQVELPCGVRFFGAPHAVALPPTSLPAGPVKWVHAPSARHRWLPTAAAVLASLPH